jgi:hypothetical protein
MEFITAQSLYHIDQDNTNATKNEKALKAIFIAAREITSLVSQALQKKRFTTLFISVPGKNGGP